MERYTMILFRRSPKGIRFVESEGSGTVSLHCREKRASPFPLSATVERAFKPEVSLIYRSRGICFAMLAQRNVRRTLYVCVIEGRDRERRFR